MDKRKFLPFLSARDKRAFQVRHNNWENVFLAMRKSNKILAYVQILVIVCLMVCNGSISVRSSQKYNSFPCKGHQCGCKSELDCMTHCCCFTNEKQEKLQTNGWEQKSGIHAFISSVNCKNGNDPCITLTAKYIVESKVQSTRESFLCFYFRESSIFIPEVLVSPPEKPPRCFA